MTFQSNDQPPIEEQVTEQTPTRQEQPQSEEDVKDVKETGRCGFLSRREVVAICVIILGMIAVTFTGVYVAVKNSENSNNIELAGSSTSVPQYQLPVKPEPKIITDQDELDMIINELSNNSILSEKASIIPSTVAGLLAVSNEDADPYVQAAAWLTSVDTMNAKQDTVARFVLATMYYMNGGASWKSSTNWLSATSYHCDWYGVTCCENLFGSVVCRLDSFGQIVELDLYKNNLAGPIPTSVVLLPYLHAMYLNENNLTGSIPGKELASMSNFGKLYVQYNYLNGTVPEEISASTSIDTIYIHGNNITGDWPATFCPLQFGLDCLKISCDSKCCSSNDGDYCFYTEKSATIATTTK